jgi:hypothetical protein
LNYAGKFGSIAPDSDSSAHFKIDSLSHLGDGGGHGATVTIPDAHLLFAGDYARSGADLIVSDQLHRVVVPNYFQGDKRPALVSPDGAPLDPKVIEALTGHVQYAQAAGTAPAAKVVGHVVKETGSASIVRNGVTVVLNNGDAVYQNDVVQTGSGSSVGLVMVDGTTFNLSANARLMLNDLTYDANSTSNTSLFTLVQGAASFVAGQVAKTGDMKVGTPVATMGIRGTAVTLDISSVDGKVSISVIDQRDGLVHSVQVLNAQGVLIGTVTSNGSGLTLTPIANFEVIAQLSDKTPAQIQQEFNIFRDALQLYEIQRAIDPNLPQHTENNANPQQHGSPGSTPANPLDTPVYKFSAPVGGLVQPDGGPPVQVVLNLPVGIVPPGSPAAPPPAPIVVQVNVPAQNLPSVVTPPTVSRISSGDGDHSGPAISADGRFITYDPDGAIFLYDRESNTTITIAAPGGGFTYTVPTISSDGHFIVYQRSDGIVFLYNNNASDVAHYGQTTQIASGTSPAISGDGSRILVEHAGGSIGIYDQQGHELVKITPAAVGVSGTVWKPAISADGHVVTFWSSDAAAAGGSGHLYTYNLSAGAVTEIASTATGAGTNAASISADGHYIVYQSAASGGHSEIHLYNLATGHVVFSTANPTGASYSPVISPDGHFIVFASDAKLTPDDTNGVADTYVVDVTDPDHPVYSLVSAGGNAASNLGAAISAGGLFVAFGSKAAFSADDTNGVGDIFLGDPTSGRSAAVHESANSPSELTASGVIHLTGGDPGSQISVTHGPSVVGTVTATIGADGNIHWTYHAQRSDFSFLHPGEVSNQDFDIFISLGGTTTKIPVRASFYDADLPVAVVNAAPVIHNANLTVSEGDTVLLNPSNIGISDLDDTRFTFKVTNVTHGMFQVLVNGSWYNTATFTSAELAAGQIRFMHDGGEAAPTFSIEADDGHALNHRSNVLTGTVNFTHVNDAPVITAASLVLTRGGTAVLDPSNFSITHTDSVADFSGFQTRPDLPEFSNGSSASGATLFIAGGLGNNLSVNDPDSSSFTFTVSNVTHGVFQTTVDGVTWVDATTFSSADLSAGHVRFAHDGSASTPTFSIQADDGSATNNLSDVFTGGANLFLPAGGGIFGDVHDNTLTGTAGDDLFYGLGGNDTIDGLAGTDMAVYSGPRSSYTVNFNAPSADHIQVVDSVVGRDGTDTLTSVELLQFSDEIDLVVSGSCANPVNISGLDLPVAGTPLIARTGSANDFLTVGQNISGHAIDLGAGSGDTVNLSGLAGVTVNYTLSLLHVEKLNGSAANDSVTLVNNTDGIAVDLGGGNNTLYLARGANSLSVTNVHSIIVDPPVPVPAVLGYPVPPPFDDTLTLLNNVSGVSINLGGGTNTLNLAAGCNSLSVQGSTGVTHINGTFSNDTLTLTDAIFNSRIDLRAGDDMLTLGVQTIGNITVPSLGNTIVYADGDGADIVGGFTHGNLIDLTGVSGVHALADLHITECGGDTVIHFGYGNSLTLTGVSAHDLNNDDFVFTPNHAPEFSGENLALIYTASGAAVSLVDSVSATDIDSFNYAGGSLTATVTDGGNEGDTLSIANSAFIFVGSGGIVSFDSDGYGSAEAIAIGTLANNTNHVNSVTVHLNDHATDAAVEALAQAIQFQNVKPDPVAGTRTVTYMLNDGGGIANGGQDSDFFEATVDVTSSNHAPVLTAGTVTSRLIDVPLATTGTNTLSPAVAAQLNAPGLISGLGGEAGFGTLALLAGDDNSSGAIDFRSVFGPAGLDFFGTNYTSLFINNNGNVTFHAASSTFTPTTISAGVNNPIIAPFWADVDTRGHGAVYYDRDSSDGVMTITWDNVGYFNSHTDKLDSFQLVLINEGNGNFDIEYRYGNIQWTTGTASGGSNGLGGTPAHAGYSAGDGVHSFELPQSGNQAALLALPTTNGNTGIAGVDEFNVRNGEVGPATLTSTGTINFADPDLNDNHDIQSVTYTSGGEQLGALSLTERADTTGTGTGGQFVWTYTANAQTVRTALDSANTHTQVETFEVVISDGHGGTLSQTVSVTLNGIGTPSSNAAPVITTDHFAVAENPDGTTTVSGLSVFDGNASPTETFMIDAVTAGAGSGSSVTPSTNSGHLTDVNAALATGVVYHPGMTPPQTDKVTFTVTDGFGATDTVNFIFNQAGAGPNITLQGTAGKDVIFATGHTDTLTGGAAADQFVFRAHSGHDTITDFTPGQDRIDLLDNLPFTPGVSASFNNWIDNNATPFASGTLIHLDADDSILLSNVNRASLHMSDFILHPGSA